METEYELSDGKPVVFNSKSDIAAMIVKHIASGHVDRHLNEIEAAIDRRRAQLGIARKPDTQQVTSFRVGDRIAIHTNAEGWERWVGLRGVVTKVNLRTYRVRFDECEKSVALMTPQRMRHGINVSKRACVPESSWIKSLNRKERKG